MKHALFVAEPDIIAPTRMFAVPVDLLADELDALRRLVAAPERELSFDAHDNADAALVSIGRRLGLAGGDADLARFEVHGCGTCVPVAIVVRGTYSA